MAVDLAAGNLAESWINLHLPRLLPPEREDQGILIVTTPTQMEMAIGKIERIGCIATRALYSLGTFTHRLATYLTPWNQFFRETATTLPEGWGRTVRPLTTCFNVMTGFVRGSANIATRAADLATPRFPETTVRFPPLPNRD